MSDEEFMRRDQVPEGHEWQAYDGETWHAPNTSWWPSQWVRVRPVAATPPDRWTVRDGDIDNGDGLYLRLYAYEDGVVDSVTDDRAQEIADLLNGGVLRPAAPTEPPADTPTCTCGPKMQFEGLHFVSCPASSGRWVGSPVPALTAERDDAQRRLAAITIAARAADLAAIHRAVNGMSLPLDMQEWRNERLRALTLLSRLLDIPGAAPAADTTALDVPAADTATEDQPCYRCGESLADCMSRSTSTCCADCEHPAADTVRKDQPPVRSCCSQRHYGAECPDGLVMCCLCFERVPKDRLNITDDGAREDVCVICATEREADVAAADTATRQTCPVCGGPPDHTAQADGSCGPAADTATQDQP